MSIRTLVCLLALAHAKTSKTQTIPFSATDGTILALLQCFTRTAGAVLVEFCGQGDGTRLQSIRKATTVELDSSTGGVEVGP